MSEREHNTKKPVIGITCGEIRNRIEVWSPVTYGQSQTYVQSVIAAGGVPLLLPLTADEALIDQLSGMLDGLLLAGGNDIDPVRYGQESQTDSSDYSTLRDTTELLLLGRAMAAGKPLLGICRGMQLLNVYLGGTLHQDLTRSHPGLDHAGSSKLETLVDLSHELRIADDSRLASIIGTAPIGANAHHHQAVDALGAGLRAVAWASDGVIEGIEHTDYPFAFCIQAHPESLTIAEPRWAALFDSFIRATKR